MKTSFGLNDSRKCSNEKVTIPEGVVSIDNSCFATKPITQIEIPATVRSIGDRAFWRCSSLEEITLPDSVTTIGEAAFSDCSSLETVNLSASLTTIGDRAFSYCSSLEEITLPDSVTTIGERAFSDCSSLETVNLSSSLTAIGEKAFYNCSSLEEITLPDSLTTIGDYAFGFCSSLDEITLPDSVTTIGEGAFHNCSSLDEIILPDSVTNIGHGAFCQCKGVETLDMPAELNKLADEVFQFIALDQLDFSKCRKIQKLNLNAFGLQVRLGAVYMPPTLERLKGQSSAYFDTIFLPPTFRKTPSGAFLSRQIVCYSEKVESPSALLSCCKENLFLKPGYVETFVACLEAEGEDVESVGEGCYSVNGKWVGPIPPEDLYLYDD